MTLLPRGAVATPSGYTQVINPEHRYLGPRSGGAKVAVLSDGVLEQWYAGCEGVGFGEPGTPARWRHVAPGVNEWVGALPARAERALRSALEGEAS